MSLVTAGCLAEERITVLSGARLDGLPNEPDSCRAPASAEVSRTCETMKTRILETTVRFQIDYWVVKPDESGFMIDNTIGHGTVKDGRYLVTHNHFGEPFGGNSGIDPSAVYSHVQIYDVHGELLEELPGKDVTIVVQDQETLILDFKERNRLGFFESLGVESAEFADWRQLPVAPNTELAQVDWDGVTTRVDWTAIRRIRTGDSVTELVMFDGLLAGASGGGVFLDGCHIGNNWTTVEELDPTGIVVGQYSTAALNSERVAAIGGGITEG